MQKDTFDLADEAIARAYPDCDNRGRGWWGATRIPNYGILRGAIEKTILAALAEKDLSITNLKEEVLRLDGQIAALKTENLNLYEASRKTIERQAEEIVKLGEALDTIESMATDTIHDIQGIAQAALNQTKEEAKVDYPEDHEAVTTISIQTKTEV